MNMVYKTAWREGETVLFIDALDCKYAAKNGNVAWRINNPGLVKHHCPFARKNGSIGTWDKFAIFSNPLQGHQALKDWLRSKTIIQSNLYVIGKHYQSIVKQFAQNLASSIGVLITTKIKDLTQNEFESLVYFIEKLCGFTRIGNEEHFLLPKIAAKIECPGKEDLYLIGKDVTLTHQEAIKWVVTHHLDAVVVHLPNGNTYLRSRPRYHMPVLRFLWEKHCATAGEFEILARMVGQKSTEQCTWGFINGVRNTREESIESSELISKKAGNERVISLRNDQVLWGAKEVSVALLLKIGVDTPIVKNAVRFLRYLLSFSESMDNAPIILFAHSQGAAIAEHAITLLSKQDRKKIRVFTFGGWSFIAPDAAHSESHNYASIGDLIPRVGAYNSQYLAMRRYEGLKKGLSHDEIIQQLAFEDAIHDLDCLDTYAYEKYVQERYRFYRNEFKKISNVTVVDSESTWEHSFKNESYQHAINEIIEKYRKNPTKIGLIRSQDLLIESFV